MKEVDINKVKVLFERLYIYLEDNGVDEDSVKRLRSKGDRILGELKKA